MELPRPTCLRDLREADFLSYLSRVTSSEGFERRQVQKTPLLKLVALQSSFLSNTIDDCVIDLNAPRAQTRLLYPLPHQDAGPKKALVRSDYPLLLHQLSQASQSGKQTGEIWLVGHEASGNTVFSYYLLNAIFDFATEDFGLLLPTATENGLWHVTRRKVSYVPLHENECPRTVWSDERHRHHGEITIGQSWIIADGSEYKFPENIDAALRVRLLNEAELGRESPNDTIIRIPNWNCMDILLSLFWCHRHLLKDLKDVEERIKIAGPIPGLLYAPDIQSVANHLTEQTRRAVNGEAVNLYQLFLTCDVRMPISQLVASTLASELQLEVPTNSLWDELQKCRGKSTARNSTQMTTVWSDGSNDQTEPETDPTSATRLSHQLKSPAPEHRPIDDEETSRHHSHSTSRLTRLSQSSDKYLGDTTRPSNNVDDTRESAREDTNINCDASQEAGEAVDEDCEPSSMKAVITDSLEKAVPEVGIDSAAADGCESPRHQRQIDVSPGPEFDFDISPEVVITNEEIQPTHHVEAAETDRDELETKAANINEMSESNDAGEPEMREPLEKTIVDDRNGDVSQDGERRRSEQAEMAKDSSPASSHHWADHLSTERTFGDGSPEAYSPTAECHVQSEDGETPPQRKVELPMRAREEEVVIAPAPVSPMADGTRHHSSEMDPIVWISAPSTEGAMEEEEETFSSEVKLTLSEEEQPDVLIRRQIVKQATTDMIAEPDLIEGNWQNEAEDVVEEEEEEFHPIKDKEDSPSPSSPMSEEWGETLLQDIEVLEAQRAKAAREMRVCEAALFTMKRKLSFYRSEATSGQAGKRRKEGK